MHLLFLSFLMHTDKIPVKHVTFMQRPSEIEWKQAKMQLDRLKKMNNYLTDKVEALEHKCIPLDLNSFPESSSLESTLDSNILLPKLDYERLKIQNEDSESRIFELLNENSVLRKKLKTSKKSRKKLQADLEELRDKQDSSELENQIKRVEMKVKATSSQREQMHEQLKSLLSQLNE